MSRRSNMSVPSHLYWSLLLVLEPLLNVSCHLRTKSLVLRKTRKNIYIYIYIYPGREVAGCDDPVPAMGFDQYDITYEAYKNADCGASTGRYLLTRQTL